MKEMMTDEMINDHDGMGDIIIKVTVNDSGL
jgi:hypothetical protein